MEPYDDLSREETRAPASTAAAETGRSTGAAEGRDPGPAGLVVRLTGGPLIYLYTRTVPTGVPADALDSVLRSIRAIAGQRGTAAETAGGLEWKSEGRINQLLVAVRPGSRGTVITVGADRSAAALLTVTGPVAAWVIAFGVSVAVVDPSTAAELAALGIGYFVAAVAAARTIWGRTAVRLRRVLEALADEVTLEVEALR